MVTINANIKEADGKYCGTIQIQNGKGEKLNFEVSSNDRHDAELKMMNEILIIKEELIAAWSRFETTSTIRRASAYEHKKRERQKLGKVVDKITRLYAAKKNETECKHIGDIDGFIPNIAVAKVVMLNGYGSFRIVSFNTTIDIEQDFIIQNVIMKEE